MTDRNAEKVRITVATPADRSSIYHLRHEVYAAELGQHSVQPDATLSDALDENNIYIIATVADELAGFISITPPELGRYSIEKYLDRGELPIRLDDRTYEVRILTVSPSHRYSRVAWYLMYAAFRWIDEHNGEQIIAMGRTEVLSIYESFGAQLLGCQIVSGAVTFELMKTSVSHLQRLAVERRSMVTRFGDYVDWNLGFSYLKAPAAFTAECFSKRSAPVLTRWIGARSL